MQKLKTLLDTSASNLMVRFSQKDLSLMPLGELESLLDKKDNTIKSLICEVENLKKEIEYNSSKVQVVVV